MAVYGQGNDYDITFKAGDYMKTTASQYMVCGMQPTSTNADWTVYLANNAQTVNNTITAYFAMGINQTRCSSGSEYCDVRVFGISKAVCASSIAAGQFVVAYSGASTTARAGHISPVGFGVSCTVATTSITAAQVVIGRALEDGSTDTVISIFVNPQLYDRNLIGEV